MTRYVIKLELDSMSHSELKEFSVTVAALMDGNLNYPTPNPSLVDFVALLTDFSDALAVWGTFPSNRGSSVQYAAVLTTREALEVGIVSLADSCSTTTPYDKDAFLSGGWQIKKLKTPVGLVGPVADFHQVFNQLVPSGGVKLKWKIPLGAPRGSISVYRVMHSLTADINSAVQIALVSKTTYTDLEAGTRPSNFYWIIPVSTAGFGDIAGVVIGYPQGPVVS